MFPAKPRMKRGRVLVVEDDDAVRRSLHLLLTWQGLVVQTFASAEAALSTGAFHRAAAAVLDYRLPGENGLGLLRQVRRSGWHGRAVLITGYDADALTVDARTLGVGAVLAKPLREHELLAALT